jgi:hypothetical protein
VEITTLIFTIISSIAMICGSVDSHNANILVQQQTRLNQQIQGNQTLAPISGKNKPLIGQ